MDRPETQPEAWVSSVELLQRTGISRATLNNYIRMGILPAPVVQRPARETLRAPRVGYFPPEAMATLRQVLEYKRQGRMLPEVLELLRGAGGLPASERARPAPLLQLEIFPRWARKAPAPKGLSLEGGGASRRGHRLAGNSFFRTPTETNLSILAVATPGWGRLGAAMLPEAYFPYIEKVMNKVYKPMLEDSGGIFVRWGEDACAALFPDVDPERAELAPAQRAAACAGRLGEALADLGREGKRQGWEGESPPAGLALHAGREWLYAPAAREAPGVVSSGTLQGETLALARLAAGRPVWATREFLLSWPGAMAGGRPGKMRSPLASEEAPSKQTFASVAEVAAARGLSLPPFPPVGHLWVTEWSLEGKDKQGSAGPGLGA